MLTVGFAGGMLSRRCCNLYFFVVLRQGIYVAQAGLTVMVVLFLPGADTLSYVQILLLVDIYLSVGSNPYNIRQTPTDILKIFY